MIIYVQYYVYYAHYVYAWLMKYSSINHPAIMEISSGHEVVELIEMGTE